jgi:tellurite resistance protein
MTGAEFSSLLDQFRQALAECRELYRTSAQICVEQHAEDFLDSPKEIQAAMDELHKGLLVKVYVVVSEADRKWSTEEQQLAEALFEHLWNERLFGENLREAARQVSAQAYTLTWYNLIRPFDQISALRERIGELETLVMRVANIVAKADGEVGPAEVAALKSIQDELATHLHPLTLAEPVTSDAQGQQEQAQESKPSLVPRIQRPGTRDKAAAKPSSQRTAQAVQVQEAEPAPSPERLAEALAQLDALIGLDQVKEELRTLINFLSMQRQREQAGLPVTRLSLHSVFGGNPGTGKTTVARLVGQVLGAMGILARGHLIETDRSGLVAEYAGQTGPKTNRTIDEALGGVLFIDEAYSLVAESDEDPYGREAVQTLVKRMEDDREQLVIILAGYPGPLERLLASNPGLSSRFINQFEFADYRPNELGRIFGQMCERNHYTVPNAARVRLLLAFDWLHHRRDETFGNGRLARNIFERSIRRMANRIAGIAPLTTELLTTIEADDLALPADAAAAIGPLCETLPRFTLECPGCKASCTLPASLLGKKVKCNKCQHRFEAGWGEPVMD